MDSSLNPRVEDHSPEDDIVASHLLSIAEEDEDNTEEHFPTVSLDEDVWMEEPVPERHSCIYMKIHHMICALTHALYNLNPLHLTPEDALMQYIDLN